MTTRARVILQRIDNLRNLVNRATIGVGHETPLHTVDRAPNRRSHQPTHPKWSRRAPATSAHSREPRKNHSNSMATDLKVHTFGGNQRERLTQIKTHLTTKHTPKVPVSVRSERCASAAMRPCSPRGFRAEDLRKGGDCMSHKNLESC